MLCRGFFYICTLFYEFFYELAVNFQIKDLIFEGQNGKMKNTIGVLYLLERLNIKYGRRVQYGKEKTATWRR